MLLLGADNLLMLILFEYQAHIICFSGISQSGTYYSYNWHYYISFWHVLIILSKYGQIYKICIFERANYGQVGCPWKDIAKYTSEALVLGQ